MDKIRQAKMLKKPGSFSPFFYHSTGKIKTGKGFSEMLDFLEFIIGYSVQGGGSHKKSWHKNDGTVEQD